MILFIIHGYEETAKQLIRPIESLRTHYPDSPLLLLWDAPPEEDCRVKMDLISSSRHSIKQIYCKQRLKPLIHGGAWTYRFLKIGLEEAQKNPELKHIICIDPETIFLRKIAKEIPQSGIFSNLVNNNRVSLQGGALGFNLDAVTKLVESKLLFSKKFQALKYSYRGSKNYFKNTHISCQDAIVYDVALELNIKINNFEEFSCYPDFQADKIDRSKAIIHPVPLDD